MKNQKQRDLHASLVSASNVDIDDQVFGTAWDDPRAKGRRTNDDTFFLEVSRIRKNSGQVRQENKTADSPEIKELAQSISDQGLRSYPEVRYIESEDIWEIVTGEGRFTACTEILKWEEIPVRVVEIDDAELIWVQTAENLHRRALTPHELAAVVNAARKEGMRITQIAEKLRKSKTFVQKVMTVSKQLTADAADKLAGTEHANKLDVVYQVATVDPENQESIAQEIVDENLNQAQVQERVRNLKVAAPAKKSTGRKRGRAKPFSTVINAGKAKVSVTFRKSQVSPDEVRQALLAAAESYAVDKAA